jgi:cyclic dehypoxanthinyl futalosine synthase
MLQSIKHVQASWPTMGPEIAQLALFCGADDFGSTMFEENVVSSAGARQQTCLSETEIRRLITEAGFTPQKRSTDYSPL